MNENEEEKRKKKSAIDYANQGINKGRDAYNTYQKVQGVVRLARGAQAAAEGAEAVSAGAGAATSGPAIIIILLLLLIVTLIIVLFGGGSQAVAAPTCTGITSSSTSVSPTTPVTLTENGCSGNPTYAWTSSDPNGVFSSPSGASTTFTPSAAATGTITITMNACSPQGQCNPYSIDISVSSTSSSTCKDLGGSCQTTALCKAEGSGTIAGATDCNTGVCCNFATFTCPSGNYSTCLKAQFGLTVIGASNSMLKEIFSVYSAAFENNSNYVALFKSRTPAFTFVNIPGPNGAFAIASSGDITFYQGFVNASNTYQKYVLIHESGHIIASARPSLQTNLYAQTYQAGVDRACFDSIGILKTYPINVDPYRNQAWSKIAETFAESLADTLLCTGSGTCKGNGGGASSISNFPSTCAFIVNYIKTKVL